MVNIATGLPGYAVARPALLHLLDGALECPLTLMVAPAGAGKSVLIRQWVESHPEVDSVWLTVGASDNDPVHFSQRLLGELARLNPRAVDLAPLVALNGGGLGRALLEAIASLLADLRSSVLVLDDLHDLSNASLLSDLNDLVGLLPDQSHLILSSRVDPPIAWSRYGVRSGLNEIRQAQLAFDVADSADLLKVALDPSVDYQRMP